MDRGQAVVCEVEFGFISGSFFESTPHLSARSVVVMVYRVLCVFFDGSILLFVLAIAMCVCQFGCVGQV